ncbi:hypothetical protein AZF37_09580 [endosymbiont 'TC1' of Trimyema compressum]|uniref:hypothetical protein n=1 Tax=endosymbiont 'TC1' of Trimyema compressum TaxID=243899 RepID=UPI0007F1316F|nr:hypothetical protein [endosymbiont 'TC1' of Trimyema compressum]AMP21367.1 hypothetical protein AZF37_09580 [endosymbiont 'TC1' of Trimyema compressum]
MPLTINVNAGGILVAKKTTARKIPLLIEARIEIVKLPLIMRELLILEMMVLEEELLVDFYQKMMPFVL